MVNSRHLFLYFSLFNTVDRKWMFYIKGCRWLDTNCGPLVWKQPLSHNHCPITILTLSPFQSCTSTHSWTQWQTLSWRWLLKRVSAWVAIMCCCLSPPSLNYWSHISLPLLSLSFFSISFPYSVFLFSFFLIFLSLLLYSFTLFVFNVLFLFLSCSLSSSFFLSKSA